MTHWLHGIAACGFVLLASTPAGAQSAALRGRFAVHVNGAFQSGSSELRQALSHRVYGEDTRFQASHEFKGGPALDAGGHVLVWRQLSVGATYTELNRDDDTTVTGTVPHPLFFNLDRTIASQSLSLTHRERATRIHAAWAIQIPDSDRLVVTISGGPSFFNVTQGVVTDIVVSEAGGPPFAAVNVDRVVTADVTRNTWGAHVGGDVSYMLTNYVGVGGFVRFSRGSIDVSASGGDLTLDVGGVQAGGGIRFRF